MTQRSLLVVGVVLIALATLPDLFVVPVVGPINLLFSAILSAVYAVVGWMVKDRAGWLGLLLAIPFGVAQFFTPVPYWVCADAGYTFCPSIAGTAFKSAVFNTADALIILLFVAGYASILVGMRSNARSAN